MLCVTRYRNHCCCSISVALQVLVHRVSTVIYPVLCRISVCWGRDVKGYSSTLYSVLRSEISVRQTVFPERLHYQPKARKCKSQYSFLAKDN